eukprot:COSAG06_NODE_1224_length_10198_cov_15.139816_15_plen_83_part_00
MGMMRTEAASHMHAAAQCHPARSAERGRYRQCHPSIMECQRHAFDFPQATDSNLCYLNSSYLGPYVATPATPAIIAAVHLSD